MTNRRVTEKLQRFFSLLLVLILTISTCLPAQADVYGVLAFITKRVMSAKGVEYEVKVSYDWTAGIPSGAELEVREITEDSQEYQKYLEASRAAMDGRVTGAGFLDISIMHDGQKIEPKSDVTVEIRELGTRPDGTVNVVHFLEHGSDADIVPLAREENEVSNALQDETVAGDLILDDLILEDDALPLSLDEVPTVEIMETKEEDVITFTASSFSVYGVVYTVDFHWNVDGEEFEYSINGGDSISLRELAKAIRLFDDGEAVFDDDEPEAGIIQVAEEDQSHFLADVKNVAFSDDSLIWVGKTEEGTTAGELIEEHSLNVQYSDKLSSDEIEALKNKAYGSNEWILISLLPFESEETLTITMKDGEQFVIRVTDAQLKKRVIAASGETYEITVTYGVDAEIPDGAELKVTEILPGDEGYLAHFTQAQEMALYDAEFHGIDMPLVTNARIFDIEILEPNTDGLSLYEDRQKIEPAAPVQVSISMVDMLEDDFAVIHFAKEGLKVMDYQLTGSNQVCVENYSTRLSFEADEFSIYTVTTISNASELNGKSYALVAAPITHSNTTYDSQGRALSTTAYSNNLYGTPVQGNGANDEAATIATGVLVGGAADEWKFIQSGSGYKLVCDGNYLRNYNNNLVTTKNESEATVFYVTTSNNKIKLRTNQNSGNYVQLVQTGGWINDTVFGLGGTGTELFLCQADHSYDEHKAVKIASTEMRLPESTTDKPAVTFTQITDSIHYKSNQTVVIYKKADDGKLYAIDGNGGLVEVSEDGGSIYWRGDSELGTPSIEWELTLYIDELTGQPNGYYELTNKKTGKILNPGADALVTNTTIGVTMYEKDTEGGYGTTIEAWPSGSMVWYGLKYEGSTSPTLSRAIVGFDAEGNPSTESQQFMFAYVPTEESGTDISKPTVAETVETVDSDTLGIKIKMFNYEPGTWGDDTFCAWDTASKTQEQTRISAMHRIMYGTKNFYNDYTTEETNPNLLRPILTKDANGNYQMPVTTVTGTSSAIQGASFSQLFTGGTYTVDDYDITVTETDDVNHLFIKSTYEDTGYFHYSSMENYAYLNGSDFIVYQQVASPHNITRNDQPYFYHGHFMPYNDIEMDENYDAYLTGMNREEYDLSDPRIYERVYGIKDTTTSTYKDYGPGDFFYGMSMEANFYQKVNGADDNGEPIIFHFAGDDDMWVYLDGILVLDLGGVHEALTGEINFSTGEVNINGTESDLKTLYIEAYDIYYNISESDAKTRVEADFSWRPVVNSTTGTITYTFADLTSHHFNMYYMERGAGAANLDLEFNLALLREKSFVVEKKIEGTNSKSAYDDVEFKYRAYRLDNGTPVPLTSAVYEGTNKALSIETDGTFWLKADEAASFTLPDTSVQYYVEELGFRTLPDGTESPMSTDYFDQTTINGDQTPYENGAATSTTMTAHDRARVNYKNYPNTQKLNIFKDFYGDVPSNSEDEEFEFYVRLENRDGTIGPYIKGPYYMTKEVGGVTHYFTYDSSGQLEDKGPTKVVCAASGNNGSIAGIKKGYTITIEKLLPGTEFFVSEREDRNPQGYLYHHKVVTDATTPGTMTFINGDESAVTDGIILRDKEAKETLYNEHGQGQLTFKKENAAGQPVKDAIFTLYTNQTCTRKLDVSGDVTATSDANGNTVVKLANGSTSIPIGDYYMKETTAPTGYAKNDTVYFVHIAKNGDPSDQSFIAKAVAEPGFPLEDYYRRRKINSVVNELVKIVVRKVDEEGLTLFGASFQLTRTHDENGDTVNESAVTKPASGETDTGTYEFSGLKDGTYKLHETPPSGYTGVGDVTFKVKDGEIKDVSSGVTWDNKFTFTVKNTLIPVSGQIKVLKKWLDQDGKAINGGDREARVKIQRYHWTVPVEPEEHNVTVTLTIPSYWNSQWDYYDGGTITLNGKAKGSVVTLFLRFGGANENILIGTSQGNGGGTGFTCDDANVLITTSYPYAGDNNYNFVQLVLTGVAKDINIAHTFSKNQTWIRYQENDIKTNFTCTGDNSGGTPSERELDREFNRSNDNSHFMTLSSPSWTDEWTIGGTDSTYASGGYDFPAKDARNKDYDYYIVEVDEDGEPLEINQETDLGYTLTSYSNNDGIQEGIITAYNKVDTPPNGSLQLTKAVTVNNNPDTTTLTNGTYKFSVTGVADTSTAGVAHTVEITFANGKASSYKIDTSSSAVTGTDNTWPVLLENLTPGEYIITETDSGNLVLSSITGGSSAPNLPNKTVRVTVTAGQTTSDVLTSAAKAVFTNNFKATDITFTKTNSLTNAAIEGAWFTLSKDGHVVQSSGTVIKITDMSGSDLTWNTQNPNWFQVPESGVKITNLTEGVYTLQEQRAPEGYVISNGSTTITVSSDGTIRENGNIRTSHGYTIPNEPGAELPATGGPGTIIFYTMGFFLTTLAAITLLLRQRTGA